MLGLRLAISLSKKAEKYSTSKCISTRKTDIHNSFEKHMIEELPTLIAGEVYNQCHGCQVDHPSQRQHELYLFKTRQEHTDMFIEKVMMELNPYKIMEKWYLELIQMNLDGGDYVEAYKLWQDIKHNILSEFTESWLQSWCDKVKQSWEESDNKKTMYTYEIQYILDHGIWIKNLQAKVCAKDQLPRQNPIHVKAYIVNTKRSNKAGEHWVAVIFNNNGNVLYFDSYGLPPLETEIINFLDNHSSSWRYNRQRLQSLQSKVCGLFCIFTLDAAARAYNIQKYLQQKFLSPDHHKNDREMYSCGLINNTEIYTMKSQRLPTYSKNGHTISFNIIFTIIVNIFLFDCCICFMFLVIVKIKSSTFSGGFFSFFLQCLQTQYLRTGCHLQVRALFLKPKDVIRKVRALTLKFLLELISDRSKRFQVFFTFLLS